MNIVTGFSQTDNQRLNNLLSKLAGYFSKEDFVVVGSVAVNYHLTQHHISPTVRSVHDLNIILKVYSAIRPDITEKFKVYHNHKSTSDFYLALVDPESKTYANIFNYRNWPPQKTILVEDIQIVSLEDQLVRHMEELSWVLESRPRNKHMYDATKQMLQLAELKIAQTYWEQKGKTEFTLLETMALVDKQLNRNSELLVERLHKKKNPYVCEDCTLELPITPMQEIFELLDL